MVICIICFFKLGDVMFMLLRKMIVVCASLGLVLGSCQALALTTVTGTVNWYFTNDQPDGSIYTFINIKRPEGPSMICYNIGNNAAYATIFAAKQLTGANVTVSCDNNRITQVAN